MGSENDINDFPEVKKTQVLLMRAESSTGIILSEDYDYQLRGGNIYTIFDELETAQEYIKIKSIQFKGVDFTVFNSNREIVLYVLGQE